jgi:hypothetical protein
MSISIFRRSAACICLVAACTLLAACDDEIAPFGGGGGLDDGTTGGDSDSDADVDECTDVAWGSGLTIGEPVANWSQSGYIDGDGDYVIEEDEVEFTLEDINCAGHNAIVVLIGDTS